MLPVKGEVNERQMRSFIRKATRSGAGFATPDQIYAAYVHYKSGTLGNHEKGFFGASVVVCYAIAILIDVFWPWKVVLLYLGVASICLILLKLVLVPYAKRPISIISRKEFFGMLRSYCAMRPQDRVITEPSLRDPPPEWEENDIYDYGAKGILIVDQDLLVDFFVCNGFHRDKAIVVVSESGYPAYIAQRCRDMLKKYPSIPVGWLHSPATLYEARERLTQIRTNYGPTVVDLGTGIVSSLAPFWKNIKHAEGAPPDSLGYNRLASVTAGALLAGLTIPAFINSRAWGVEASEFPGDASTEGGGRHEVPLDQDSADGESQAGPDSGDGFGDSGGAEADGGDFG